MYVVMVGVGARGMGEEWVNILHCYVDGAERSHQRFVMSPFPVM